METQDFARMLVGIVDCGNATTLRLDAESQSHLKRILTQWLLYSENSPDSLGQLSAVYPTLTPTERRLLPAILRGQRVTFQSLASEVWKDEVSDERIVQALRGLLRKLPHGWRYSVSRSNHELRWTTRPQ